MTEHVQNVCKIGQGALCCKYLVAGTMGLECMKSSPGNKAVIDKAWAKDEHVSQGDNCEGVTDLAKLNELQIIRMQPGDYVNYVPASSFGNPENGRIKSIGKEYAFVVYHCNGDWKRYDDYTGQRTSISNLKPGWVDKDGDPIATPDQKGDGNATP